MTVTFQHASYGRITYDESFWLGKKTISINGVELFKKTKKVYLYKIANQEIEVLVRGSFLLGVKLEINGEVIELVKPAAWYEIACSIALTAFIMVWGNSHTLCSIIPIVGGALGGAIAGVALVVNLFTMKLFKDVSTKILIWLAMLAATFVTCFLLALVISSILI